MFWEELDHEGRTGDFQGDSRGMNDVSRVGPGGCGGRGSLGGGAEWLDFGRTAGEGASQGWGWGVRASLG